MVSVEKNKIKIDKVTVSGPPFYGESFVPTNVNFLFGKNGSGKSTISRTIKEGTNLVGPTIKFLLNH